MRTWLARAYYRWIDRELCRPVASPAIDKGDAGTWNRWVGETGERLAAKALRRGGYRVLYRNFRAKGGGEIDIVCRHGEVLVFVEVKTRTSEQFGRPAAAVDREKQGLLIRGANAWLRELDFPELLFRFDIVEVVLGEGVAPEIRILENAFQSRQVGLAV